MFRGAMCAANTGLVWTLAAGAIFGAAAVAGAQYGPCAADDHGETVTLRNRVIRATIAKNEPVMQELSHRDIRGGRNLIHRGYYLLNYAVGRERKVYAGRNMQYRLVKDTPEHVEVLATR